MRLAASELRTGDEYRVGAATYLVDTVVRRSHATMQVLVTRIQCDASPESVGYRRVNTHRLATRLNVVARVDIDTV